MNIHLPFLLILALFLSTTNAGEAPSGITSGLINNLNSALASYNLPDFLSNFDRSYIYYGCDKQEDIEEVKAEFEFIRKTKLQVEFVVLSTVKKEEDGEHVIRYEVAEIEDHTKVLSKGAIFMNDENRKIVRAVEADCKMVGQQTTETTTETTTTSTTTTTEKPKTASILVSILRSLIKMNNGWKEKNVNKVMEMFAKEVDFEGCNGFHRYADIKKIVKDILGSNKTFRMRYSKLKKYTHGATFNYELVDVENFNNVISRGEMSYSMIFGAVFRIVEKCGKLDILGTMEHEINRVLYYKNVASLNLIVDPRAVFLGCERRYTMADFHKVNRALMNKHRNLKITLKETSHDIAGNLVANYTLSCKRRNTEIATGKVYINKKTNLITAVHQECRICKKEMGEINDTVDRLQSFLNDAFKRKSLSSAMKPFARTMKYSTCYNQGGYALLKQNTLRLIGAGIRPVVTFNKIEDINIETFTVHGLFVAGYGTEIISAPFTMIIPRAQKRKRVISLEMACDFDIQVLPLNNVV